MITYAWHIDQLEVAPNAPQPQTVVVVYWRVTGSDGAYNASVIGRQCIEYNPSYPFTPFEQLSEAQVITWVKAALGEAQCQALQDMTAQKIAELADAPTRLPLPWLQAGAGGGAGDDTIGS